MQRMYVILTECSPAWGLKSAVREQCTASCIANLRSPLGAPLSSLCARRPQRSLSMRRALPQVCPKVRANPLDGVLITPDLHQVPGRRQVAYAEEVQQVASIIEAFVASLPRLHSQLDTRTICHLLVIHTQAHVAMILLYRNVVEENGAIPHQCLDSARAVVMQVIGQVDLKQLHFVDPILAVSDLPAGA